MNKKLNELYLKILELQKEDRVSALTLLFDEIEDRLIDGKYDFCEEFMKNIQIEDFSVSVLVGVLIITRPFKDKLMNREDCSNRIRKYIYDNHDKEESDQIFQDID